MYGEIDGPSYEKGLCTRQLAGDVVTEEEEWVGPERVLGSQADGRSMYGRRGTVPGPLLYREIEDPKRGQLEQCPPTTSSAAVKVEEHCEHFIIRWQSKRRPRRQEQCRQPCS